MNLQEIIRELQSLGYDVTSRKRSDGGYIITEINGQKYTGAHGNTRARTLVGASLSEAKAEQLSFNVAKYIKGQKKPKDALDDELIKELRKTQRAWNKARKQSGVDFGRITKRKLRYHVGTEGRSEALAYLRRATKHAEGWAYPENVEHLLQRMKRAKRKLFQNNVDSFQSILDKIESIINAFPERWIAPVYEYTYDVDKEGVTESMQKEAINKIANVISA